MLNLIREKRSTLAIKIDDRGEMSIKAPKSMPINDILEYVNKHERWIKQKQNSIKQAIKINQPITSYSKFLYLGNAYDVVFSNSVKEIEVGDKYLILPQKHANKKLEIVEKWLKQRALNICESRILYLAKTFNIGFSGLKFINSKNRWGTCSPDGVISLNWRIAMLPPTVIDYVILHELAHTIEFNHSNRFWAIVERMMPEYKKARDVVKNCNYILSLFR